MRETEPDIIQPWNTPTDPPAKTRLLCWFGIYFVAQLPLISMIAGFYLFPIGLGYMLVPIKLIENYGVPAWFVLAAPYALYVAHLVATLATQSKSTYRTLLVVLIVLVVLNLVGCESMLNGLHNIN